MENNNEHGVVSVCIDKDNTPSTKNTSHRFKTVSDQNQHKDSTNIDEIIENLSAILNNENISTKTNSDLKNLFQYFIKKINEIAL